MSRAVLAVVLLLALLAGGASRAAAQIAGMPLWNSPRGGSRFSLAGDVGFPDSVDGKGETYAARASFGLQALTLAGTIGSRNPSGAGSSLTEYGGTAAYRVVGGSLIPVAVNLQGGVAGASDSGAVDWRYTAAIGLSIDVPVPYVTLEPWIAPGVRVTHAAARGAVPSHSDTQFGFATGLTFGFGLFGIHAAYDYEKRPNGGHASTLGIGLHIDIRAPLGL